MQTRSKTAPAKAPVPPAVAPKKKTPPVSVEPAAATKKKSAKALLTVVPDPHKNRPKGPKAKPKAAPVPYLTEYSVDEILKIVRDWTTPDAIKNLSRTESGMTKPTKDKPSTEKTIHPGVDEFYKEINLKKHCKTATVLPFIQYQCGKMFNPQMVT